MTDRDRETCDCKPAELATADPDTMSSGCVRALQEENERLVNSIEAARAQLRAEVKLLQQVRAELGEAQIRLVNRIDAALAIGRSALAKADRGSAHLAAAVVPMVAALKGEEE